MSKRKNQKDRSLEDVKRWTNVIDEAALKSIQEIPITGYKKVRITYTGGFPPQERHEEFVIFNGKRFDPVKALKERFEFKEKFHDGKLNGAKIDRIYQDEMR